jgi:hypothetical protein
VISAFRRHAKMQKYQSILPKLVLAYSDDLERFKIILDKFYRLAEVYMIEI